MKKLYFSFCIVLIVTANVFAQNGWVQIVDYPGDGSAGVVGFQFYGEGLAGMGYYNTNTNCYNDFWAYQPLGNVWVQKTAFPGPNRYQQSAFTIGKFGYICLGSNAISYYKDMWQYDEDLNSWTQKADFPGVSRYGAVAYGRASSAYVGLGEQDNSGGIVDYKTDFYEYDEATNTWSAKANFPGQGRFYGFPFFVNGKFYVVAGRSENGSSQWVYIKDMWAYDPGTNTWTQKTSYPGSGSMGLAGFVLGQYAYLGLGYDGSSNFDDFWRYDPVNDTWLNLSDFPGGARRGSMCFAISTTGYLGCGYTSIFKYDFWKYNEPLGLNEANIESSIKLYPVPSDKMIYFEGENINKITIYTSNGNLVKEISVPATTTKSEVDISGLASGHYYAKIYVGNNIICKKVIKN